MMKARRRVMSRLPLPARSLRGRPASLRTVPDGAGGLLRKRLIWLALLVMRPAISEVEPIFLPTLRERGRKLFNRGPLMDPCLFWHRRSAVLRRPRRLAMTAFAGVVSSRSVGDEWFTGRIGVVSFRVSTMRAASTEAGGECSGIGRRSTHGQPGRQRALVPDRSRQRGRHADAPLLAAGGARRGAGRPPPGQSAPRHGPGSRIVSR
jgi:hypothetical protein